MIMIKMTSSWMPAIDTHISRTYIHIYIHIIYIYILYIYIHIIYIYMYVHMSSGGMWTNILGELLWCWCAEAPNDSIGHEATQMPPSAWAPLMHREGSKPWFASLSDHEFLMHWDGLRENPMVSYRFSWRDLSIEKNDLPFIIIDIDPARKIGGWKSRFHYIKSYFQVPVRRYQLISSDFSAEGRQLKVINYIYIAFQCKWLVSWSFLVSDQHQIVGVGSRNLLQFVMENYHIYLYNR